MDFDIFCTECGCHCGTTTCELTATIPTVCDTCYIEILDEIKSQD